MLLSVVTGFHLGRGVGASRSFSHVGCRAALLSSPSLGSVEPRDGKL